MELASLRRLRSLTLSGGNFSGVAAQRLLKGLAVACPQLEELHVLPLARSGLGDDEVPFINELTGLKVCGRLDSGRACMVDMGGGCGMGNKGGGGGGGRDRRNAGEEGGVGACGEGVVRSMYLGERAACPAIGWTWFGG
jgi:hypothetical protein